MKSTFLPAPTHPTKTDTAVHLPFAACLQGLFTGDLRLTALALTSVATRIAATNATFKGSIAFVAPFTAYFLCEKQKQNNSVLWSRIPPSPVLLSPVHSNLSVDCKNCVWILYYKTGQRQNEKYDTDSSLNNNKMVLSTLERRPLASTHRWFRQVWYSQCSVTDDSQTSVKDSNSKWSMEVTDS